MNDGGGESGKVHERPKTRKNLGGEDFPQALAKIAVAQICESEGFQTFQQSALETLADIAVRYVQNIGKTANFCANFAGRTECNVFDIIQALEDLGSIQGFAGALDIEHCLASSSTVKEIARYVAQAEEIPFAYAVPKFPVVKERKLRPTFLQIGEETPGKHIPSWLPALPDPETYIASPTVEEKVVEPQKIKTEPEKQCKSAEKSLWNLQQWLFCNGLEGSRREGPRNAAMTKQTQESNPFLAPPLQFGEKEVSSVVLPDRILNNSSTQYPVPARENCLVDTHVSVLETFAPAIESMKNSLHDSEEKFSLNRRSTVQFKIGTGKKPVSSMIELKALNNGVKNSSSWFVGDDKKDDKKRKAEKILKNSIENSNELYQL
ncbi:transcription initiation factor TFIID subunit 8-like [Cucurbita pepo subsp. pepo]|uniref:transcription initiation factor TFIID subunit 8-like n=1 Tax=Cucurbita pepo subsp. pepo TaxID=3664 RepID=UPI000C9D4901|nr:transcription initiation factor TFIID subunit 8-like [Cucurbita pepo subsp. pepo]